MKFLGAELEDRVEITVENDWNLRPAADLADEIENAAHSRASRKRTLRGQLIHNPVGERIRKWQAKLEKVGPRFFERQTQLDCLFEARIAGANVGNKPFALLRA